VFAKILNGMGIKCIADFNKMKSEEILIKYNSFIEKQSDIKAKLGLKDIEYCKRFSKKLDEDIEWK
jgi:hypothetical protein